MLTEFCQETTLVIEKIVLSCTQEHHQMINTKIRLIILFAEKDREALYSQQKQDRELIVAQTMNSLLSNSDIN